ncbi:hypothetical protein EV122DRAFT_272782 [Schizophyllum commune]
MSGVLSNFIPEKPKDKLKKAGVILDQLRSQLEQEPDERVKRTFQNRAIEHERVLTALSKESSWPHPLDHRSNVNTAVAELKETKKQFLTASEEARKRAEAEKEAARKAEEHDAQVQVAVSKMFETYEKYNYLRRPPVPPELQPQELAPRMKSRSASTHTTDMPSAGASAASVGSPTKGHRHTDTVAFGGSGADKSAVQHSGSIAVGRARTSEEHSMMSKTSSYGSSDSRSSHQPRHERTSTEVFGGRTTSDDSHLGHRSARSSDSTGARRNKEEGIYSVSSADLTKTTASGPYGTNYTHAKKESMSASRSTSELNTSQWQRERTPAFLNAPGAPVQYHGDPRGSHDDRKTRGRQTLAPPAQYPSGPTGGNYPVGSGGYSSGTNYPASGGGHPAAVSPAGGSAYLAPPGGAYHAPPGGAYYAQPGSSYYPPGGAYYPPGPGQPSSSGAFPAPSQAPYPAPAQPPRQSSSHKHSSKHGSGRR